MKRLALLLTLPLLLVFGTTARAGDVRIRKVLPHFMDEQGRISVSPSLFDRDTYQQTLRENPSRVSGIRFDVQWKCPKNRRAGMVVRLELRTARGEPGKSRVIEAPAQENRRLGGWSSVMLSGNYYAASGEVLAWRAVLLENGREVAEQKSFLW